MKYVAENPATQQQLSDAEAKAQQGYEDAKQQAQVCCSYWIAYICLKLTIYAGHVGEVLWMSGLSITT